MVTIKASYNVIPKEPTPIVRLDLSDNDQMLRRSHVSTIYVYNTNPNLDAIERMSESLSTILVNYYPIAGRLSWIEGGRLELNCNAKGALLLEAESIKTLDEYGDFSPNDDSIKELTPSIDYSQPLEEIPLLVVQLTRFHGGKGVAIGISISHPLCDGFAATRFINTWAKVSRGDKLNDEEKFPFLDRSIIKSPHPPLAPRFEHLEFKGLPLKLGSIDSKEEQKKKLIATTLKLTSNQVEKLKNKANEEKGSLSSRPYSRFESIAAHIWRCACKARELDENQPTRARFNVDVRNRLNPPLPPNYFGNAVAPTVSPLCYVGEIMSKPLSFAAQMIREGSELITNDYIRSQQDFVRGHEEMDGIRPSFKLRGEDKNNAPFYGNPNINFVILMRMPWGEVDFGWGKSMYFGPSLVCPTDKAILIDSSDGDGSVIISMHFQEVHMELFTKFFWQDI